MVFLQSPMTYSERGGFGCKKSTRLQVFGILLHWYCVLCFFRMSDPGLFVFWENSIFLPSPMFGAALNFRQNIICILKV